MVKYKLWHIFKIQSCQRILLYKNYNSTENVYLNIIQEAVSVQSHSLWLILLGVTLQIPKIIKLLW